MNKTAIFLAILSLTLIISSCDVESQKIDDADKSMLLAGYHILAGEETPLTDEEGIDRATAPTYTSALKDYTYTQLLALTSDLRINNYPERGQKTTITVAAEGTTADIYLITSRTEYPKKEDTIDYYLEQYYVQDTTSDDLWIYDPVVKYNGTSWVEDPMARVSMEVVFKDGSIRKEWIADMWGDSTSWPTAPQGERYAHFALDGFLTIPGATWTPDAPGTGNDIYYSSKVYYYHKTSSPIMWHYQADKEIFGVRYYTESADPNQDLKTLKTSLALERTIAQATPLAGVDTSFNPMPWILDDTVSGDASLAKTVIRYQITENNQKSVVASSLVKDTFGTTEVTVNNDTEYLLDL